MPVWETPKQRESQRESYSNSHTVGKELKPWTWGFTGNPASGFQFLPGFNKKCFHCHFGKASLLLLQHPPHLFLFQVVYDLKVWDSFRCNQKPQISFRNEGGRTWEVKWPKTQSHQWVSELELKPCLPDSQIFPSYQEGPLAQSLREPTDVDPKCSSIEKGMTWVPGMCRLSLQQAGISRANFTYYLSVRD